MGEFAGSRRGQPHFCGAPGRAGVRREFPGGALPVAPPNLLLGSVAAGDPSWKQPGLRTLAGYGHSQAHFSPRTALHCPHGNLRGLGHQHETVVTPNGVGGENQGGLSPELGASSGYTPTLHLPQWALTPPLPPL